MTTAILEKPMLFSGPMVRAILDGRKCQTRRVVKFGGPSGHNQDGYNTVNDHSIVRVPWTPDRLQAIIKCPHPVGSRIWVRETWAEHDSNNCDECANLNCQDCRNGGYYKATESRDWIKYKSPIHMPRWASRITLEVTDVRVQRLQEISEEDAKAEGVIFNGQYFLGGTHKIKRTLKCWPDAKAAFSAIWQDINGLDSWQANPWVWAYTFKRVEDSHAD